MVLFPQASTDEHHALCESFTCFENGFVMDMGNGDKELR